MSDPKTRRPEPRFDGFESIPMRVWVRVGTSHCSLSRLSGLTPGEVLELDQRVGEPFELRCGGVLLGYVEPVAEKEAVAMKLVRIPEDDDAGRD